MSVMKCSKCGSEVSSEAMFCSSCGAYLRERGLSYRGVPATRIRPAGLMISTIATLVEGIILLFFGLFISSLFFPSWLSQASLDLIRSVFVAIGITEVVIAFGYFRGSGWAWSLGFAFSLIGFITGPFIGLLGSYIFFVFGTFFSAFGIFKMGYLTRPYVRQFFGK